MTSAESTNSAVFNKSILVKGNLNTSDSKMLEILILIFFFFYNRAAVSANGPPDELKTCCGQFISRTSGWEHKHCSGKEEDYHVGGLVIELERCPHVNCGSRFPMNPLKNLAHQDTVHRSIILYSCGACRACYVSEGALNRPGQIRSRYESETWSRVCA